LSPDTLSRLARPMVFESPALESPDTAWACHLPFAFWIVDALAPRTLVELGVHAGVSYCAFCQAVRHLGLPTAAYGVDTWAGDAHAGHYQNQVLDELRAHHDPRYGSFSHLVQASFDEAREHFAPGSVDLLHIDGYHTYDAVRHDFETWRPAMSERGVILFHDVTVRDRDFGVWRFWDEVSGHYPSFLFTFGHGLGVLGVGESLPEPVAWLLRPERRPATPDADIVGFFAPLGRGLEAQAGLSRALRELAGLRQTLAGAERAWLSQRAELHGAVRHLEGEVRHLEGEAARLQAELVDRRAELAAMQGSLSWRLTRPLRLASAQVRRLARLSRRRPGRARFDAPPPAGPRPAPQVDHPLRADWYDGENPEVSLIVLNFNKPDLTSACLDSIWRHTRGFRYEVVLVDNGSSAENFLALTSRAAGARILRLEVNRFFGEGNNLGFEASRGRYVVFLNNDVTVTEHWLEPLIGRLAEDAGVGGIGPMMVYPDGRLQEAGARVRPDGSSEQYGKGGDPDDPAYAVEREVGYVSAAALALRRETFEAALGFDLCFEPAYYEDADLCMKIAQLGLRVVYCPASRVVHHENATSRDYARQLQIQSVIALNRERFVARWKEVLEGRIEAVPGLFPSLAPCPEPPDEAPSLLLYTPYDLAPGGGERYLLTLAAGLAGRMRVTLATPHPYSRLRLRTLGRELGLNLDALRLTTLQPGSRGTGFDFSIVMGNEALPSVPGLARRNLFLCQFPFPASPDWLASHWACLEDYAAVVVYSDFAARHYRRAVSALGRVPPPLEVIHPAAALAAPAAEDAPIPEKRAMVLGVGRFFAGGHNKRHDLMIQAFRSVLDQAPGASLHLAGSITAHPEHLAHFDALKRQAQGLPVFFHPNASPETLANLYAEASVYWHLAGYGVDEAKEAHRCEHFGITVVEAMSAGCVTLVFDRGGPPDIVEDGVSGFVFDSLESLTMRTVAALSRPQAAEVVEMRLAAVAASRRYTATRMVDRFMRLLEPDAP